MAAGSAPGALGESVVVTSTVVVSGMTVLLSLVSPEVDMQPATTTSVTSETMSNRRRIAAQTTVEAW